MITISISTGDLHLSELAADVKGPLLTRFVEALGDIAYSTAFFGALQKTGYLASTISLDVEGNVATGEANASYAGYVERGTAPHTITPINASVLVFPVNSTIVFTRLV